jgi:hypothetical protein
MKRRDFIKSSVAIGGLSLLPFEFYGCASEGGDFLYTPKEYDIFYKYKAPGKIYRFDMQKLSTLFPDMTPHKHWILKTVVCIFQGLVNRIEPRLYLKNSPSDVDWLSIYQKNGYALSYNDLSDFEQLLKEFCPLLNGYIVIDPVMPDTINVAQTWGSLENWMVVTPEMVPLVEKYGLKQKEDLRGRWQGRVDIYEWAFENLFARCSKHVIGDCCIDYPHHPSEASFQIRDFLVANKAFTVDLSASLSQRKEYKLLDKIYDNLEFPSGVWGWHDSRDRERWAVDRAARKNAYTICAYGGSNYSVHGGVRPKKSAYPKQKPSTRKNMRAEKNKVYIAWMMSDGDALWVMNRLQLGNWGPEKKRSFPVTWGFLPLLADLAPALYLHYINEMNDNDYMVAGPSGAGYTYPFMYDDPRQYLRYSKFYMQKCGLEIVHHTNWNDYTNWQDVDLPDFNQLLYEELDNCIGYVRGMGESAFEQHYNFGDKPYVFCGEGMHRGDKDDVDTIKSFIDANPNRPLFIFSLNNIATKVERMKKVVDSLDEYDIEYVRLDDFMYLINDAYQRGLITEDLYPNRKGNEQILIKEAPASWQNTRAAIKKLEPIIKAPNEKKALVELNSDEANLARGQQITDEDKSDILAFALCESMFGMAKDVFNLQGVYVNLRKETIEKMITMYKDWPGIESLSQLMKMWEEWEERTFNWQEVVRIGKNFLKVVKEADRLFSSNLKAG